jgi:predicted DNA-binding protein
MIRSPRPEEHCSATVAVRLTANERQRIEQLADHHARTVSSLIRKCLRENLLGENEP